MGKSASWAHLMLLKIDSCTINSQTRLPGKSEPKAYRMSFRNRARGIPRIPSGMCHGIYIYIYSIVVDFQI